MVLRILAFVSGYDQGFWSGSDAGRGCVRPASGEPAGVRTADQIRPASGL